MGETDEPRQPPGLSYVAEPPLDTELIGARFARLMGRLRESAQRAGRDPDGFRIVAVTKTWPIAVARAALAAGVTALGENRVQEAEPKIGALPDAEWHLVGRLQSNKARRAARLFAFIHSVDSVRLLELVDQAAAGDGVAPRLLIQVNVSRDPAKAGIEPQALVTTFARAVALPRHAQVVGLMAIGREGATAAEARATYRRLRELRDELQEAAGIGLPELSMGMTADADAAVAEGATLVRVGTALFGPRVG